MKRVIILLMLVLVMVGCTNQGPDIDGGPGAPAYNETVDVPGGRVPVNVHDGNGNPIGSLKGALDIHDADVHTDLINHFFFQLTGANTTLNVSVNPGDRLLQVTDSTGFTPGQYIDISNGTQHIHHWRYIVSVTGNNITIDAGVDSNFSAGSRLREGIANMAVDGSVTPQIFELTPETNETLHILRLLIAIEHDSAADDSRFGSIPALTNGVVIRKSSNGGKTFQTYTVWRSNKDMKEDMYNVDYSDKAGGGNFATNGRWTIKNAGNIFRVDGNNSEVLQAVIQDDLTDLLDFQIKNQGHPEE